MTRLLALLLTVLPVSAAAETGSRSGLQIADISLPEVEGATGVHLADLLVADGFDAARDRAAATRCAAGEEVLDALPLSVAAVVARPGAPLQIGGHEVAMVGDDGRIADQHKHGALIDPLHQRLRVLSGDSERLAAAGCAPWGRPGERFPRRLALVLDARLPMQTVYEVANTAAFSGFDDLMLVVDDATVERSTRLGARPAEEPPELPSTLVFFRPTTYALVGPESSQDVEVPCGGPCSDDNVPSNALPAQLTPLRAQVPSSHVVISPADTTSLTRLARTLVALRAGVEDGRGGELRVAFDTRGSAVPPAPSSTPRSRGFAAGDPLPVVRFALPVERSRSLVRVGGLLGPRTTAPSNDPIILGPLDRALIDEVVQASLRDIRACYDVERATAPNLAGRLVIKFVVAPDGTVKTSQPKTSSFDSPALERCVAGTIRKLRFPEPEGGGIAIVTYPFTFGPQRSPAEGPAPPVPTIDLDGPEIVGTLDRKTIDEVIGRNSRQLRYCYQRRLAKDPSLRGELAVRFTIGRDGTVVNADVAESTVGDREVELCVLGRFLRMQFPEPAEGTVVKVTYPFEFRAE